MTAYSPLATLRALAEACEEHGEHSIAADHLLQAWASGHAVLSDATALIGLLSRAKRDDDIDTLAESVCQVYAGKPEALNELAYALNLAHHFATALNVATRGLAIDATHAGLNHQASYAHNMFGHDALMRAHAEAAANAQPANAFLQFNLAAAMLRMGEFRQGWQQYRWHEALPVNVTLVQPPFPEWQGEPVQGKRFLLVGEQGLGDQIQFLRLAAWLHGHGAAVGVWVDPPLKEIASSATGVHEVWTTQPSIKYDFWCRMLQMPKWMDVEPSTLHEVPYLTPPPQHVAHWRAVMEAKTGAPSDTSAGIQTGNTGSTGKIHRRTGKGKKKLRAGLVWAGSPTYELDRYRSIPLQKLMPVLANNRVAWVALQKGDAQREVQGIPASIGMMSLGPEINTFLDTLAILPSLDLLITVDTSVAHLAGAAGLPVWILLPACTDWRWMSSRHDSAWYPSARLFRQRELGQWDDVIAEVNGALAELTG